MGRHARRLQRVHAVAKKREEDDEPREKDENLVDIHEENFCQDEIDEFHDAKERLLLEGRSGGSEEDGMSGEEEEVLGLSEESESGDDDEFQLPPFLQRALQGQLLVSDEEEEEKSKDAPDRAWGPKRKTFYAVEGEDELSGSEGSEMAAELEEKEAIALQKRLTAAISEADFKAPALPAVDGEEVEDGGKEERVVRDFSRMTREDKLSLLERESPELFDLLEDFDSELSQSVELLRLLHRTNSEHCFTKEGIGYLRCKLHMSLLYCMNIMFYLYMKASSVPVKTHPVIQRLVEIKKLIGQLEPLSNEIEEQIEVLASDEGQKSGETNLEETSLTSLNKELSRNESGSEKSKKRKIESKKDGNLSKKKSAKETDIIEGAPARLSEDENAEDPLEYYKRVAAEKEKKRRRRLEKERVVGMRETEMEEAEFEDGEDGKRAVTYQISRNRGLIPQRKKELRNPRVKHRRKFRKALIKHKGQVREVVKELNRYGGEASGIRASVAHSIRIT